VRKTYADEHDGFVDVRVDFADGVSIMLAIVRTSPSSGDDFSQPERVISKASANQSA